MLLQMYPPCFVLMLGKRSLSAMCEMAKSSQLRKLKLELRLFCPAVSKISNNLSASEQKIVVSVLYSTTTHFNGELQESHKKTRKAKLYFFLIYIWKGLKKKEMFFAFSVHIPSSFLPPTPVECPVCISPWQDTTNLTGKQDGIYGIYTTEREKEKMKKKERKSHTGRMAGEKRKQRMPNEKLQNRL